MAHRDDPSAVFHPYVRQGLEHLLARVRDRAERTRHQIAVLERELAELHRDQAVVDAQVAEYESFLALSGAPLLRGGSVHVGSSPEIEDERPFFAPHTSPHRGVFGSGARTTDR